MLLNQPMRLWVTKKQIWYKLRVHNNKCLKCINNLATRHYLITVHVGKAFTLDFVIEINKHPPLNKHLMMMTLITPVDQLYHITSWALGTRLFTVTFYCGCLLRHVINPQPLDPCPSLEGRGSWPFTLFGHNLALADLGLSLRHYVGIYRA